MVHIHSGILLSHKKECIWLSSNEVDEPRAYYTEWSKSERQILYINTYIWNLEGWYWWTYLQGSNRDTENRLVDTEGKEREGQIKRVALKHTLPSVKFDSQWKFAIWHKELKSGALWQTRGVVYSGRWEGCSRERGHMYTYGWFVLIYGRNKHNTVKQLSFNFFLKFRINGKSCGWRYNLLKVISIKIIFKVVGVDKITWKIRMLC